MTEKKHIVVLGAGVIGLQIAVSLLEAGFKVTILAKHFPGDESIEYTSPWAGAHWRSHASPDDREQQGWDVETYNYWLSLLARELNEPDRTVKSGLGLYESCYYSPSPDRPWFAKDVLSYKDLPPNALPPGMKSGHTYSAVMINVPMYLQYLLDTATSLGAHTIKATLPRSTSIAGTLLAATELVGTHLRLHLDSAPQPVAAFVNATGIASRDLVPDAAVHPIRGQTVLVRGSAARITMLDDAAGAGIMYILPRPHAGVTVLGGTKTVGDWSAEPDEATTRRILDSARKLAPELLVAEDGGFDLLRVNVGLRPGRTGGARVECEDVGAGGKRMLVCHAYGHAGAGYQNSVGVASKVVRLLSEQLKMVEGKGEDFSAKL